MSDVLGTNTSGFDYPNGTYRRKGVLHHWDKKVIAVANDALMLKPFIGDDDSTLPFIKKSELEKGNGDTITVPMSGKFDALGIWNNNTMEGYEEPLEMSYVDVRIAQLRNAWKDDGAMSRKRDQYNLRKIASKSLGIWYAEQYERYLFNTAYYKYPPHILGDNTTLKGYNENSGQLVPARHWYCADSDNNSITYSGTAATYVANIQAAEANLTDTESDYFGPDTLEGVRAFMVHNNFKKINYKGWSGYIGIINEYQHAQLRMNNTWFQANIHAMPRGEDSNPVFSGGIANNAIGRWADILLFESPLVHSGNQSYYTDKISSAGGSNVVEIDSNATNVYRALFLGAEAVAVAHGQPMKLITKDDFDYKDKEGICVSGIFGSVRCDFVEDTSSATLTNQSSLVVSTYSPAASM